MLMSDLAIRELENNRDSFFDSCRRAFLMLFGRASDHQLPPEVESSHRHVLRSMPAAAQVPAKRPLRIVSPVVPACSDQPESAQQWRRHPQLRSHAPASAATSPFRRSARLEAERGMILARGGKFADAIEAFSAAAADPEIDLTALPGFWDLPRQGMMAAVRAYESTRRIREAAALEARMRHTLRPRAIKPHPTVSGQRPMTASGD